MHTSVARKLIGKGGLLCSTINPSTVPACAVVRAAFPQRSPTPPPPLLSSLAPLLSLVYQTQPTPPSPPPPSPPAGGNGTQRIAENSGSAAHPKLGVAKPAFTCSPNKAWLNRPSDLLARPLPVRPSPINQAINKPINHIPN